MKNTVIGVKARFGTSSTPAESSFVITLPETVQEAISTWGEKWVLYLCLAAVKVKAQGFFRRLVATTPKYNGMSEATAQKQMATWKPTVKYSASADPVESLKALLATGGITQAALLKALGIDPNALAKPAEPGEDEDDMDDENEGEDDGEDVPNA